MTCQSTIHRSITTCPKGLNYEGILGYTKKGLMCSTVKDSSVVAVQIFDQRKFKRKQDQGFLGVINLKISDVIDLELGGQGTFAFSCLSGA